MHKPKAARQVLKFAAGKSTLKLFVLALAAAGSAVAQVDLRVERMNVSAAKLDRRLSDHRVTISFRITNAGKQDISKPFRTSVSPGDTYVNGGFPTSYVITPELAAGKSVFVSEVVDSAVLGGLFNIRIEADPDLIVPDFDRTNNVAVSDYVDDFQPGRWVSIGPSRIITTAVDPATHCGWTSDCYAKSAVGVLASVVLDSTNPSIIYAASGASGVWRTGDGNLPSILPPLWRSITDSLPTLAASAVAVASSRPPRIYVATSDTGVYRSDTDGATWTQVSGMTQLNIPFGKAVMLVHPTKPDLVYLTSNDGVYRSDTAGNNWILSKSGGVTDLLMNLQTPDVLYAAVPGQGIYMTTNGGLPGAGNWAVLNGAAPSGAGSDKILLAMVRSMPSKMYAVIHRTSDDTWELYYSDNADKIDSSWQKRSTWAGGRPGYTEILAVNPAKPDIVYVGGIKFRKSVDGGKSFRVVEGPHDDLHGFAINQAKSDSLYTACDGGIYWSPDSGETWTFIGEGIANVQFYDHAVAPLGVSNNNPDLIIGGTQDNGIMKYDGTSFAPPSTVWTEFFGGDGGTVDIEPRESFFLFQGGQDLAAMALSVDQGLSWFTGIATGITGIKDAATCPNAHFQFVPQPVFVPFPLLLASCHGLWSGVLLPPAFVIWNQILPQPSATPLEVVRSAVDAGANLYYAGTANGEIWAGPGGADWKRVFCDPATPGITCPTGPVMDIRIDAKEPTTVYVALSGSSGRVFRLRRTSQVPPMIMPTDITFDLPQNLTVNTLAIDPISARTIYAGTKEGGVYRGSSKDDVTWSWVAFNYGLPDAVSVTDVEVHPNTGVIHAATFGRGVYEVTPTVVSSSPQIAVTRTLSRDSQNNVVVNLTLSNTGGTSAQTTTITIAKIGSIPATSVPTTPVNISAGSSASLTLVFPASVGTPNTNTTLTIGGTYVGGSFNYTSRITLP